MLSEIDIIATNVTYPGKYVPDVLRLKEVTEVLHNPHHWLTRPLINLVEMPDHYCIELAAPGLHCGDFYVGIKGRTLTISALNKKEETCRKTYSQREFNYSCFQNEVNLPVYIDTDFIEAVYKDGILIVHIPRSSDKFRDRTGRIMVY